MRRLAWSPVWVTLIDRRNHHLFQPLLYQVAMAGLSPASIATPIRSIVRRQGNAQVLLGSVAGVDMERKLVSLEDGTRLGYDYLIIAAGAQTSYFGHEGDWSKFALGLKTVEDALEIRRRVLLAFEAAERAPPHARRRLLSFVIIGGGPTGVEVAGALAELARYVLTDDFRAIEPRQARVILLEAAGRLLANGFNQKLSHKAASQLAELGVEVRLGAKVERIDEFGVHLADDSIEAATIVWAAGVQPNPLAQAPGLPRHGSGRLQVEADCSIKDHPEVFAIGDIAAYLPRSAANPLPGLASVAIQQGRYVAQAIAASVNNRRRRRFHYRDKGIMATIGRSRAVLEAGSLRLSGRLAWLLWVVVHIWYLIGFHNRVAVMLSWCWSYLTYRRGARLITGERSWEMLPKLMERPPRPSSPSQPSSSRRRRSA